MRVVKLTGYFRLDLLISLVLLLILTDVCFANVTVTAATGGSAIASNTTAGCSSAGWTSLTNPKIAEGTAGDVGVGNIVLTAPAGFEFNTSSAVTIFLTGSGTSTRNINNLPRNNSYSVTSITATQITFTVTEASNSTTNTLTWQNVQVRPTASAPLASGNITETGSSNLVGANASTNFGTLTEVASIPVCVITAPTVTTTAATTITATGATLNGTVSSNGATTTVSFEYGLTTGYGSTVAASPSSLTAGATNSAVTAAITGLTCNLTYHFRVKAVNSAGTTDGSNMSFAAGNCPVPTISSISPINANVGDAGFTLIINGTNFVATSQAQFGGANRATTYVSATQLSVSIPATDLTSVGFYNVTVVNPSPGGGTSNALAFSVLPSTTGMTCFSDNFTSLNISDWNVIGSGTGYYTPNVTAGRLRMTDASTYKKSMAQLQRWFPAAGNTMVLTFDYYAYSGSGADGLTVTLSDAATTPASGGYGGSLGYAQNTTTAPVSTGFNGGWLGIGLDEWGNFSNPTEGRTGYPASWIAPSGANASATQRPNAIAVRGSGAGSASNQYMLLASTGSLSPALWTSAATQPVAHKYRIIFDHRNNVNGWLTVQRDTTGTGSSFTTLIPTFDVKGANSGQATVPTNFYLSLTGSTGASTDIHEFDNLTACATYLLPVGGGIHHIEITSSNASGSTCQPITLTIKACANAACAGYTSTAVTGTLTANTAVTWGAGAPNFTIPAGNITTTVQVTVPAGTTTFGVNAATISPAATNATTCNLGGTNACLFNGAASGFSLNIPNHISCANQAVTLIGTGSGCAANFYAGARNVNLYTTYVNPASGTKQASVTYLNSSNQLITIPLISTLSASPTTLSNVLFDNTSKANMTISYPDVGQMMLTASATSMTAASANFIAAPASFAFSNISAAPLIAGRSFNATVTAKNQCGNTTPNFGQEASPETLSISHVKYRPIGVGAVNGIFTGTLGSFSNGVATSSNLNWSEVGSIDLVATLTSGNYLGSNVSPVASGTTGTTGAVGDFIPDHFDTAVTQGCSAGGFTYSGQPFTATITAMNGLPTPTATMNYDGSANTSPNFAKPVTLSEANGVPCIPALTCLAPTTVVSTAFTAGIANATPAFTFSTNPSAPATIKLRAIDSSSVTSATATEGTALIRSGRLQISNAYGSELLDLALPMTAQYWNGVAWITNTDDSCTVNSSLFVSNYTGTLTAGNQGTLTFRVADVNGSCSASSALSGLMSGGKSCILFGKPTSASGSADLSVNANSSGLSSNTARATFGIYKGHTKQIYFREMY